MPQVAADEEEVRSSNQRACRCRISTAFDITGRYTGGLAAEEAAVLPACGRLERHQARDEPDSGVATYL